MPSSTVSDDGPGLPPGAVGGRLPARWSTKEEGQRGAAGASASRSSAQTVDRLGGTLEVVGPPGAPFTVRLPVRRAAEP